MKSTSACINVYSVFLLKGISLLHNIFRYDNNEFHDMLEAVKYKLSGPKIMKLYE